MNDFAQLVLAWFDVHGRHDLPWQKDITPYRVWVSEIMLQQTQVTTVIPYYERFMNSFPDVMSLANAGIDDVLHHWSGLGYYARARNLHKAAVIVRDEFDGVFPADVDEVLALPGIGRSTAGAILAISAGQRHAILDGNVKRVLARFHAVAGWPGEPSVAATLWNHAEAHTPGERVADYTQAMMDLGATVCTRTRPSCHACPLQAECEAHASGQQTAFPGKRVKKEIPRRKTMMVLLRCDDAIYLERRPAAGIWGGLWSFPEIETGGDVAAWCMQNFNVTPAGVETWEAVHHAFTHFHLEIEPIAVRLATRSRTVRDDAEGVWYELDEPQRIGVAAPVSGLIRKLKEQNRHVPNR